MPRLPIIAPEGAHGIRKFLYWIMKRRYGGFIPGIIKIAFYDLKVGRRMGALYEYLHLRRDSPLTRLQREMLATVVNGKVGGAP